MQIRAKPSPVMHCSGNKSLVIVRKRAGWPLPSWAGEMRWRATVLQKQDARNHLPLPFMSQMGGSHNAAPPCFRPACSPSAHFPFTPSPSSFSWQTHTPFFLTHSGKRASRTTSEWLGLSRCTLNVVSLPNKMENYICFFVKVLQFWGKNKITLFRLCGISTSSSLPCWKIFTRLFFSVTGGYRCATMSMNVCYDSTISAGMARIVKIYSVHWLNWNRADRHCSQLEWASIRYRDRFHWSVH